MFIERHCLLVIPILLALAPVSAQAADASLCKDGIKGDDAVSACTAYIDSHLHEGWDLAAAYLYRAKAFIDADKLDEAAADLKASKALRTPYPDAMAAEMFLKHKLEEKAAAAAALKGDPKDCREDAEAEVIVAACSNAIAQSGLKGADLAKAYTLSASAQAYLGKYPEAQADYDLAIKADNTFYAAYIGRASFRMRTHHEAEALADYNKAIELKPDVADAYVMRAWEYYEPRKDFKKAVADLEKALSLDPDNQNIASALDSAKSSMGGN